MKKSKNIFSAFINIYRSPKKEKESGFDDELTYQKVLLDKVKQADNIDEIFAANNIRTIGLFAKGYTGKKILQIFQKCSCEVKFYSDNTYTKKECCGVPVLTLVEDEVPDVDLIIVCSRFPRHTKYSIVNCVKDETKVVSIDEFLNNEISEQNKRNISNQGYFIGAGFAKCATTTMDGILRQHPDIDMACHKEPVFWAEFSLYKRGLDWYENRYFSKKKSGILRGEFNPWNQGHEKNIQNYLGEDIKFIYIVRNPIDAVISRFKHFYINGQYDIKNDPGKLSAEVFEEFIDRLKYSREARVLLGDYTYGRHFTNVLKYVDKENILLIDFNEFVNNREKTAKKVFEYLGVNPDVKINYDIEANVGARLPKSKKAMKKAARQFRFWWEVYIPFFPYLGKFERVMDKWRWSISDRASVKCDVKLKVSDETKQFLKEYYRDDVKKLDSLFGTGYYEKWKFE